MIRDRAVNKEQALAAILPRLKTTDLSSFIKIAGLLLPRVFDNLLATLDKRQKSVVDRVMPVEGGMKICLHLVDTPTPPIMIELAQPMKISAIPEMDIQKQEIKTIRLTTDDILLLAKGRNPVNMLRLGWRHKGQMLTILGILHMLAPLLQEEPSIMKDIGKELNSRLMPLLDLFAKPK